MDEIDIRRGALNELDDLGIQSQINDVDPKQVIRNAFELLKILPPKLTWMSIYIGNLPSGAVTQYVNILHVLRESEDLFDLSDEEGNIKNIKIRNVNDLFKYIKDTVSVIELTQHNVNGDFAQGSIILFMCQHKGCYDMKRWAATKIQSKVRGWQLRDEYYNPYTDLGKARLLNEFKNLSSNFGSSKNDISYLRKLI